MQKLITDLLNKLAPVLKSVSKADALLLDYFDDKIALIWTAEHIHRAANEQKTVLTEAEARRILTTLLKHYNPQYGLHWQDVVEAIQQSGFGRDMRRNELKRFIHKDEITIEPPSSRKARR